VPVTVDGLTLIRADSLEAMLGFESPVGHQQHNERVSPPN
jgi:hypothetical protein